jgi:hypothetical protein
MQRLRSLLERLTVEHLGWFGAGLGVAAAGVLGYQLVLASLLGGLGGGLWPASEALSGPEAGQAPTDGFATRTPFPTYTPWPTRTPSPTYTPLPTHTPWPTRTPSPTSTPAPTRTPRPTATPYPTRTPYPAAPYATRTPDAGSADALATIILADPDAVVGGVATFAARTNQAFATLEAEATPGGRR